MLSFIEILNEGKDKVKAPSPYADYPELQSKKTIQTHAIDKIVKFGLNHPRGEKFSIAGIDKTTKEVRINNSKYSLEYILVADDGSIKVNTGRGFKEFKNVKDLLKVL